MMQLNIILSAVNFAFVFAPVPWYVKVFNGIACAMCVAAAYGIWRKKS